MLVGGPDDGVITPWQSRWVFDTLLLVLMSKSVITKYSFRPSLRVDEQMTLMWRSHSHSLFRLSFSQFGFFDDNETVVEMQRQGVSKIWTQSGRYRLFFILRHCYLSCGRIVSPWGIWRNWRKANPQELKLHFLDPGLLKGYLWSEDVGRSRRPDLVFCSVRPTCLVALKWDCISHLHGEVAGLEPKCQNFNENQFCSP